MKNVVIGLLVVVLGICLQGCSKSAAEVQKVFLEKEKDNQVSIGEWQNGGIHVQDLWIYVKDVKLVHKAGNEYNGNMCGEPNIRNIAIQVPSTCVDISVVYDGKELIWHKL